MLRLLKLIHVSKSGPMCLNDPIFFRIWGYVLYADHISVASKIVASMSESFLLFSQ